MEAGKVFSESLSTRLQSFHLIRCLANLLIRCLANLVNWRTFCNSAVGSKRCLTVISVAFPKNGILFPISRT